MATELRLRRGTTAQHAAFTGAMAEVTVDTQTKAVVVHDGVTPGGFRSVSSTDLAAGLATKQNTLGFTPENTANKGQNNGYASLDATGKVPAGQLPSIGGGQEVITPTNVSPANAATGIFDTPTLTGSTFYSNYAATHDKTQVQISTNAGFTAIVHDSGDATGSVNYTVPSGILVVSTTYYWRIRYKNTRGTYSDYSAGTSFTTAAAFNNYIATPAATPAVGASFEGGFYAGLIWNEVVQSTTSKLLATGSQTFTVPNMATTPIVYGGQTLEIRSRANPNNHFKCTVTAAVGTSLTVNVTSISGSGTFSDWSIMSRYRVIVAPKASGESNQQFKNATSDNPTAAYTPSEGRKATTLLVADGNSSVYPVAHFCNSLNIAGRTDWYCPSRDEFNVIYAALKPTADANVTSADAPINGNLNTYGAYGDGSPAQGINLNSSPQVPAYTSSVPAQTGVAIFQSGGTEALSSGLAGQYWTLTQTNLTSAAQMLTVLVSTSAGGAGKVINHTKTNSAFIRACRRSII